MDRRNTDFSPPPEEYRPPAEEFFPPPEEFGAAGSAGRAPGKRRLRRMLLAAACAAVAVLSLRAPAAALPPSPPEPPAPVVSLPAGEPEPTERPALTPEPSPAPTAVPTPEPSPEPTPGCEVQFICFSADHWVRMHFTAPEKITRVTGEIWETNFESLELSFEVPDKDLELGSSTYRFDDSDIYFRHMDEYNDRGLYPELELRLRVEIEGAEPLTYVEQVRPQLGWSLKYDSELLTADDYTYPGCFVLQTYEDYDPRIVIADPGQAVPGAICISGEIEGYPLTEENSEYFVRGFALNDYLPEDQQLFNAFLIIPRPEGALHGTAHFTVTQILDGYNEPFTLEYEFEY